MTSNSTKRGRGSSGAGAAYLALLVLANWWAPAFCARAANWYVDNAATGSSNGASWANAWPSFAAVVWGGSGVNAGDTLYISGGSTSKTYTETWSVGASGTASSRIRIAIDAANPSHNGVAIFDYDFAGDLATQKAITCARSYVTFDGNVNGACHLAISNLRNIVDRIATVGIYATSSTGLIIDHVASTNCNNPIRVNSSPGFRISNCNLRQVRGDAAIAASSSGTWDANVIYSNVLEMLYNPVPPPGFGPDGIQCGSGLSIYGNTFIEQATTIYVSDQHPDTIQATGNYLKFYGNEIINVGDSVFDYDCYANPNPHDVWIYNNLFRITTYVATTYPEYFRLYASFNSISSISNFKILNNTFTDNNFQYRVITFSDYNASPTAAGNEIKDNLFYNCGGGNASSPVIYIGDSTNFDGGSFAFDANIYYLPGAKPYIDYRGTNYTASSWISAYEPKGKTNAPKVVRYTAFSPTNDFHLQSTDTIAKDGSLTLSNYFSTDLAGVARPQGAAWDIGAYEYNSGGGLRPLLSVRRAGSNRVVVSWPSPSTGWQLQQSLGLNPTDWTNVLATPADDGTNKSVAVSPLAENRFYRLHSP